MSQHNAKDEFTDIVPEKYEMPEGYAGNLSEEHQDDLYQMWIAFFDICDKAQGTKSEQKEDGFAEDWGVDTEATKSKMSGGGLGAVSGVSKLVKGSGIDKEDDKKAAAQARTEEANMERLLSTYGSAALRNSFWVMVKRDNPDILMLRFLRARKWSIDATTAMLASTLKWRLDTNLDILVQKGDLGNGKEIPKYVENFEANGKVFSLGTNLRNQPVMYVQFGKHVIWAQPQATTKKFIIAHFELVRLLVVPPNDKIVLLFDCTGFGPSNLDVINFLYILQCLQSYFPEQLAVLILHKAPWILSQAWHLVKWLLDPVVRAKVRFTNKPEELMEEIPRKHMLRYIGGDVDVEFDWVPPEEGENDLHKNKEEVDRRWENHRRLCDQFEKVTRKWAESKGQEYDQERRALIKRLRVSHMDYDPFWRGRWVHDRNGDLSQKNPGMIRWQYPMVDGSKTREILGHDTCRKTLVRELQEIGVGAPVDFAEARTQQLIKEGKWGDWNSCDDLPAPPTGFQNGALTYEDDGGLAAALDVIGLNGPETLQIAKANGTKPVPQKAAPTPQTTNDTAVNGNSIDQTKPNGTAAANKDEVVKSPRQQKVQTNTVDAPAEPANEKLGMFGSLKKKIMA
ncbi:uncharacterized protein FA14DRAFT_159694 [Meira miltonrushii]|uniref:CRAL-TRIO domain-containing protein n=1 Tax=Meira miltonrushii TaxID=1280837 RepID=A0A316VL90_9BASI|nr:uncharacterized protein FA14DRAFT_159694 [Meira miltonrushii]PWN37838.1 hypothetical protein FA14DRAFT_159694 [Meira miltonrushii]